MSEEVELRIEYEIDGDVLRGRDAADVARDALLHRVATGRDTRGVHIVGKHRNPRFNNASPPWRVSRTREELDAFFDTLSGAISSYIGNLPAKPEVTAGQRRKAAAVLGGITKRKNKERGAKLESSLKRSRAAKKYAAAIAKIRKAHPRFTAARAREEYRKGK